MTNSEPSELNNFLANFEHIRIDSPQVASQSIGKSEILDFIEVPV